MWNAIRMELYRLFRTKAFYVILLVTVGMTIFSCYMTKWDIENGGNNTSPVELETTSGEEIQVQLGLAVAVQVDEQGEVSLLNAMEAELRELFWSLFLGIFTVLFLGEPFSSGYVKNIGGAREGRRRLVVAEGVTLLVFVLISFVTYLLTHVACSQVFMGYVKLGDAGRLAAYFGSQLFLNYCYVLVVAAITIFLRKSAFSMLIAVGMSFKVVSALYTVVDVLLWKLGASDFHLEKYSLTGNMCMLASNASGAEYGKALLVGALFAVAFLAISCRRFEQRDV